MIQSDFHIFFREVAQNHQPDGILDPFYWTNLGWWLCYFRSRTLWIAFARLWRKRDASRLATGLPQAPFSMKWLLDIKVKCVISYITQGSNRLRAYHEIWWGNHPPINKSCGKPNEERVPYLQGISDIDGFGISSRGIFEGNGEVINQDERRSNVSGFEMRCLFSCLGSIWEWTLGCTWIPWW